MRWFKFYGQDFLTDSRVGALHPFQKLMWVGLLCVASQDEERTGIIKFLSEDRLMDLCGIRVEDLDKVGMKRNVTLETFCNMGLVSLPDKDTLIVTNFNRKQTEQSTSTERVREWRARKQAVSRYKEGVTHETNVTLRSNGRIEENRIDNTERAARVEVIEEISEKPARAARKLTPQMEEVFGVFDDNPARTTWKLRTVEREAARVLFDTYGVSRLKTRYAAAKKHRGEYMCPEIHTPSQLLDKMPSLENFMKNV